MSLSHLPGALVKAQRDDWLYATLLCQVPFYPLPCFLSPTTGRLLLWRKPRRKQTVPEFSTPNAHHFFDPALQLLAVKSMSHLTTKKSVETTYK